MTDSSKGIFATLAGKSTLLSQMWSKLQRDRHIPLYVLRRKAFRYVEGLMLSPVYLRHCTTVGARARVRGIPYIENMGRISIGDDFNFVSVWVRSHLVSGHAGLLEIGNSVNINFGAAISAHEHVKIGDRVRIGPYAIIMDSDYHAAEDRSRRPTAPIVIEEDVWLAGRVTVLKGSRIGRGSVITAGSVVSGDIPAGVVAGGVPARILRRIAEGDPAAFEQAVAAPAPTPPRDAAAAQPVSAAKQGEAEDELTGRVKSIIATTFAIDGQVELAWGPNQIPKWDSLGQLRLTLSLEEAFKITISEEQLVDMVDVGRICRIVSNCVAQAGP